MPVLASMIVDDAGNLWVKNNETKMEKETELTTYDIFSPDGYYETKIWLEIEPELFKDGKNLAFFVGELEDIPDKRFGFFLPNRRQYAKKYYKFLGYILSFNPEELNDKKRIRQKLGYGDEPLVVCSIGGTSVGKELLELCAKAYPIVREKIPDLHMVLVCGPRLSRESLNITSGNISWLLSSGKSSVS